MPRLFVDCCLDVPLQTVQTSFRRMVATRADGQDGEAGCSLGLNADDAISLLDNLPWRLGRPSFFGDT